MATIELTGAPRAGAGKGEARKLRRSGRIPAVLYGAGEATLVFAIQEKDLDLIRKGHSLRNAVLDLTIEGADGGARKAIIKEIAREPMTGRIEHVDFLHISLAKKIRVNVPLHLTGLAIGVKDSGGILEHILRDVEVECLPGDIPEVINADVSALKIGDSLHVRDLVAENVTFLAEPERTIATVVPPTVFEEKKPEEAEAAAEPELIKKEGAEEAEGEKEKESEKPEKKEKK
jgi:large subunit ribosomal protein L25